MRNQIEMAGLADADITVAEKDDLTDVSGLTFDTAVPREQRAEQVFRDVKNPYCFRVGDLGVKLEFPDHAPPLQDCLADFLRRRRSGL